MSKRLFVGNLSFNTMEDDLIRAFEQEGRKVESATIVLDRETQRSRGFAFVEMATEADAQAAIKAMDGAQIDGRALKVNIAQEREQRSGGGRGFGGSRGFSGGRGGDGGRPGRGGQRGSW